MESRRRQSLSEAGARIRKLRLAAKLTQTQVALHLGIPYQVYQRYERGDASIPSDRLAGIAEALKVPVEDLVPTGKSKIAKKNSYEHILAPDELELVQVYRKIQDRKTRAGLLQVARGLSSASQA
ncbi:MAG: helix-turn-helix transcriptional regulator [Fibrobacteres bacterium]|nr:helix-turn-helix transcriptional regulator [Fibrobacterota bacterium]MBK8804615.1 helix-turn-helix transcriptional regulator [Fibrobacterota bacterium]QQS03399.1 MAG: helix-turn-helix transcriptional regulator [Fibrobacterota bacterium]